jgi:DNA-binding response OmpR family regulator
VLVVDDNAQVRAYVRRHLARHYRVLEAADGQEALMLAAEAVPDLIVSDVMMPRMDGFALCQAIKTHPELDFIPVILLTAKASQDSKIEGLETGADAFMTKPFNMRELEVRVDNLIASRRQLQARYSQDAAPFAFTPVVPEVSAADEAFLEEVRAVIVAHISDEDFGVKELATALGQSRASLYRRFETLLAQSPVDMIWEMRLVEASYRLASRAGTISEVAYSVGFKSVSHFGKRFKAHFGTSPRAYIDQQAPLG